MTLETFPILQAPDFPTVILTGSDTKPDTREPSAATPKILNE